MADAPWLGPRSTLDAYRADLASAPQSTLFGPDDGAWLLVAELLDRRARAVASQPELLRVLDLTLMDAFASIPPDRGGTIAPATLRDETSSRTRESQEAWIAEAALHLADVLEEAGALQLAHRLLTSLRHALPGLSSRGRGLITAARARTARLAGATESAADLYREVERIGRRARDFDLIARSLLGRAVLARRRGNYPESRSLYRRALRAAERADATALAGLAHHGLAIAASVAGSTAAALVHGWRAMSLLADDPPRQADLLGTLAAVAGAAGFHEAALNAYFAAARRSRAPRLRLPVLAGAAVSAARLADARQLAAASDAVERDLARYDLPYERAHALTLLSEAWAHQHPETGGEPYASRARAAVANGPYHELAAKLDALAESSSDGAASEKHDLATSPGSDSTATIGTAARDVLRALEHLDAGVSGVGLGS